MARNEGCGLKLIISRVEFLKAIGLIPDEEADDSAIEKKEKPEEKIHAEDSEAV